MRWFGEGGREGWAGRAGARARRRGKRRDLEGAEDAVARVHTGRMV